MHIERAYSNTSQRRGLDMVETVLVMDTRSEAGLRRPDGMLNVELFCKLGKECI